MLSQYLLNRTRTRIFCSLRPGLPCTVLTRKLEANIIHQLLDMAHDQSRDPNQHYPEPSGVPGSLFLYNVWLPNSTQAQTTRLPFIMSWPGDVAPTVHRAMRLPCGHLVTAQAYKQDSTTKSRRLSVGHHRQALSPAKADRLSERGPGIVAWKSPITSLKTTCCRMALPCFAAHAGAGNDRFCHVDPEVVEAPAKSQAASLDRRWENVDVDVCKCHGPCYSNETRNRNKSRVQTSKKAAPRFSFSGLFGSSQRATTMRTDKST